MRALFITSLALALAACGGEEAAPKKEARPATLPAGEYEVTATTTSLASTDKTPVPTFTKQGEVVTSRGCVGADGLPAPELLATRGDSCEIQNPFVSNGRMSLQLTCDRPGQGNVNADLTGTFTADGFTGTLMAQSSFAGSGDFRLVQEITARKVADQCTAAPAGAAPKA